MIEGLSVLAVITARGGSKGVPGKNIVPIGGRPLIAWTIGAAQASRHIDRLILSSDDPAIIDAAEAAGCEAPFRRGAALAADDTSSVDVMVDALQRVPGYDIVVLLQPTSPLRSAQDIDGALELLVSGGAPACVSMRPAEEHPYWTFQLDGAGHLVRFAGSDGGAPLRRQDLPPAWCLNGAVYCARVEWFLRTRSFLTPETVGYAMPTERSLDIDTPADIEYLQSIVGRSAVRRDDSPDPKVSR